MHDQVRKRRSATGKFVRAYDCAYWHPVHINIYIWAIVLLSTQTFSVYCKMFINYFVVFIFLPSPNNTPIMQILHTCSF